MRYLLRYAQESSWREDNRRVSNGNQVTRYPAPSKPTARRCAVAKHIPKNGPSTGASWGRLTWGYAGGGPARFCFWAC